MPRCREPFRIQLFLRTCQILEFTWQLSFPPNHTRQNEVRKFQWKFWDSRTVLRSASLPLSTTQRKLNNSNRIPRSCSGTFFLVVFFSAATRHAGVLSSSRLLRASSGHLFQMLSWPSSFLSVFFLVFGDSIPKRCKGVHCVDLGESFPTSIYLQKSASIQPRTSPSKFGEKFNSLFTSLLSPLLEDLKRVVEGARAPRVGRANFTGLVLGCIEADFCK